MPILTQKAGFNTIKAHLKSVFHDSASWAYRTAFGTTTIGLTAIFPNKFGLAGFPLYKTLHLIQLWVSSHLIPITFMSPLIVFSQ